MNVKRFYAGLTGLVLAGGFAGGLANSAQASTGPPIHGVITGLHSIRLDAGFAALPREVIRPQLPGYSSTVTVTSVSGRAVTTSGTYLPLNTHSADTAFATISGAPAPTTIAITGVSSSQKGTSTSDYMNIAASLTLAGTGSTDMSGVSLETLTDGTLAASSPLSGTEPNGIAVVPTVAPAVVAAGSTHAYTVELVDPGNVVVAASAPVTATAKVFTPPPAPVRYVVDYLQTYQLGNGPFSAEVSILPVRDLPGGGTEAVTIPAGWVMTFNLPGGQIVTSVGSAGTFTQSGSLVTITGTEPIAVTSNNYDYGFSMTYTGTMLSGYSFSGPVTVNGVIASS